MKEKIRQKNVNKYIYKVIREKIIYLQTDNDLHEAGFELAVSNF